MESVGNPPTRKKSPRIAKLPSLKVDRIPKAVFGIFEEKFLVRKLFFDISMSKFFVENRTVTTIAPKTAYFRRGECKNGPRIAPKKPFSVPYGQGNLCKATSEECRKVPEKSNKATFHFKATLHHGRPSNELKNYLFWGVYNNFKGIYSKILGEIEGKSLKLAPGLSTSYYFGAFCI